MENCQCWSCVFSRKYGAGATVTATADELLEALRGMADFLLDVQEESCMEKEWSKNQSARIAELEAESAKLRKCVEAADDLRSCETDSWAVQKDTRIALDEYDAARKELT